MAFPVGWFKPDNWLCSHSRTTHFSLQFLTICFLVDKRENSQLTCHINKNSFPMELFKKQSSGRVTKWTWRRKCVLLFEQRIAEGFTDVHLSPLKQGLIQLIFQKRPDTERSLFLLMILPQSTETIDLRVKRIKLLSVILLQTRYLWWL